MARTDDAERVAAYIAQEPQLSESIYLGPKYNKQRREKEVADLLLVHRNRAIVIQIKCQQDPEARSGDKLRNWVESRAREGCNQLRGTLNTLRDREFWCDHPTFKRVNFPKNQLTPIHGIVLVEHRIRGLSLPRTLPTEINSIPVTYLTLSDFLNHISEFRTFVDLCEFLHARHDLKDFDHHLTGREDVLRAHYFLNNGSFPVGLSQQQRLSEFYTRRSDFERFWLQKLIG